MFLSLKSSLGGPYNLRGWDYRDAGVDPVISGQKWKIILVQFGYTFKVADPLRLALFYGLSWKGDFKMTPGDGHEGWHDNWGFGVRIMVMGMPRLDLVSPSLILLIQVDHLIHFRWIKILTSNLFFKTRTILLCKNSSPSYLLSCQV